MIIIQTSGTQTLVDTRQSGVAGSMDDLVKSYKDEEGTQVLIDFGIINTSEDDYERLREACNEYIETNTDTDNSVNIDTNVGINEVLYIDIENMSILKNTLIGEISNTLRDLGDISSTDDTLSTLDKTIIGNRILNKNKNAMMHETLPIYFQDKILVRYINTNGDMQVVASGLSKSIVETTIDTDAENDSESEQVETTIEEKVVTSGRKDLASVFNIETMHDEDEPIKQAITGNILTEEEYINDITNIFINTLTTDSSELNQKLQKQALRYFTYAGYETTIASKNKILLTDDSDITVMIAEAGKSDISMSTKDRIFIQLKVTDGQQEVLTNIIVKLNNDFKVFDIDIL
jgi:hypothetical protein